jgi:hypothetical protein
MVISTAPAAGSASWRSILSLLRACLPGAVA